MPYAGRLIDSNALKFSASQAILRINFEQFVRKALGLFQFVPNSNIFNVWAHIHAYLCHKHYFYPHPMLFWKTAPGISASTVYWSRFDSSCQENEQLPAQSRVSQLSGSRIWCYVLKNLTNGMPDKIWCQSYMTCHWSHFSGYCVIPGTWTLWNPTPVC